MSARAAGIIVLLVVAALWIGALYIIWKGRQDWMDAIRKLKGKVQKQ